MPCVLLGASLLVVGVAGVMWLHQTPSERGIAQAGPFFAYVGAHMFLLAALLPMRRLASQPRPLIHRIMTVLAIVVIASLVVADVFGVWVAWQRG